MKTKNNTLLNKVFIIMSIFSITTLIGGIQLGFQLRNSLIPKQINTLEVEEKAVKLEDPIYRALLPKLSIISTSNPTQMTYFVENKSNASIYVESATIKVYNVNNKVIYETNINLYKTYNIGDKENIDFQIPQSADRIAKVEINFNK